MGIIISAPLGFRKDDTRSLMKKVHSISSRVSTHASFRASFLFPHSLLTAQGNFIWPLGRSACQKFHSHMRRPSAVTGEDAGSKGLSPGSSRPLSRHICFSANSSRIPLLPKGKLTPETFLGIGHQGGNSNSFRLLCLYPTPAPCYAFLP